MMNKFPYPRLFVCVAALAFCHLLTNAESYFVAKTGSDENPGTEALPFLTISKAASVAQAGDVCYFREGIYEETLEPENSGEEGAPITFTSYPGEKVIITAMQALSNWELDQGSVYQTSVDWDLGQENFVMVGNRVADLARWPNNIDGDEFTINGFRNTSGSDENVVDNAFLAYADGIPEFDWSQGGSLFFYGDGAGSGWTTWRSFITSSNATQVFFQLPESWIGGAHNPADRGQFFLQGIKEAIDFEYEWYFDPSTQTLFLQLPNGRAPIDGEVSFRKRISTIRLDGKHHIHITNLAVFGGQIDIVGRSSNNILQGISSFYGSQTLGVVDGATTQAQAINIRGNDNLINKCEVAFGAGSGIWVGSQYWDGTDGLRNQVINCNIHDFNFLGSYDAPVMVRGSRHTVIQGNTIFRGGRDCIQIVDNHCTVAYNDIYESNLVANDCGLLYTIGGPRNTTIHHNWFHDTQGSSERMYKACGIYLDNDAAGFKVYRNVVWNTEWTSVQINWNGDDIDIFNNTFWNASEVMGAWHMAGTSFNDVNVYNNLSNDNNWEPQADKQHNLTLGKAVFVDADGGDFHLAAATAPIDNGRIIDGYTDNYTGVAPDVGAYEFQGESWKPGIDWNPRWGPAQLGEYGLPGEYYGFKTRTAWNNIPRTVPGVVECENFDIGVQNVTYFDSTSGNSGAQYRTPESLIEVPAIATSYQSDDLAFQAFDVDIVEIGPDLFAVADTTAGEWLEYTVWVAEAGSYDLNLHYASSSDDAGIRLSINGQPQTESIQLPKTESLGHFETHTSEVELPYGRTIIRIEMLAAGIRLNSMAFFRKTD